MTWLAKNHAEPSQELEPGSDLCLEALAEGFVQALAGGGGEGGGRGLAVDFYGVAGGVYYQAAIFALGQMNFDRRFEDGIERAVQVFTECDNDLAAIQKRSSFRVTMIFRRFKCVRPSWRSCGRSIDFFLPKVAVQFLAQFKACAQ